MTTSEKLAYLKGILAATNITDTQQKRIFDAIMDLLDSIVEDVEFNAQNIDNIDSRLSEVDEDLELVESILYDDDDAEENFEEEYEDDEYDYSEDDFEEDDDEDFDAAAYLAQITAELEEDALDEEDELEDELEEDELEDELEEDELDDELEEDVEPEISKPDEAEEEDIYDDEDLEDEEGEAMYEIECPACHETIYLQESVILDGGVDCPNCGEPLEFDIEFEEE